MDKHGSALPEAFCIQGTSLHCRLQHSSQNTILTLEVTLSSNTFSPCHFLEIAELNLQCLQFPKLKEGVVSIKIQQHISSSLSKYSTQIEHGTLVDGHLL